MRNPSASATGGRSEQHLLAHAGALSAEVRRVGHSAWFERQLRPGSVPDDDAGAARLWWPDLDRSPEELWRRHLAGTRMGWQVAADYGGWVLCAVFPGLTPGAVGVMGG